MLPSAVSFQNRRSSKGACSLSSSHLRSSAAASNRAFLTSAHEDKHKYTVNTRNFCNEVLASVEFQSLESSSRTSSCVFQGKDTFTSRCRNDQDIYSSPIMVTLNIQSAAYTVRYPKMCVCVCAFVFVPSIIGGSPSVQGETGATLCGVSRGLHLFGAPFCPPRTNRGHIGGGNFFFRFCCTSYDRLYD